MPSRFRIFIATSNPGKLRDFQGAARVLKVTVEPVPGFNSVPLAVESGETFEENARIKAEYYSRLLPDELVLADDSGLAVHALQGAPGVHSARYAAKLRGDLSHVNSDDEENNRAVIAQIMQLAQPQRGAKFVCVIAAAQNGNIVNTFAGEVEGQLLTEPRGKNGFGYDPLFYFPELGKTFAELTAEEKSRYSHRGKAFARFFEWYESRLPQG
jgi:XTP/dITP diphosphohydrolase